MNADDLRKQHGPTARIFELSDGTAMAFRPATAADYRRHKETIIAAATGRSGEAAMSAELCARALCLHPGPEAFDSFREANPGAAADIGTMLLDGAAGPVRVVAEKR